MVMGFTARSSTFSLDFSFHCGIVWVDGVGVFDVFGGWEDGFDMVFSKIRIAFLVSQLSLDRLLIWFPYHHMARYDSSYVGNLEIMLFQQEYVLGFLFPLVVSARCPSKPFFYFLQ